jgi:hypothetical protein
MAKTYQGKFSPKNTNKYEGNPTEIIFRSAWELSLMFWLDSNKEVKSWLSEDIIIPYRCNTDNQYHRYFVDFKITFTNGKTILVELKPSKQTQPPKKPKKQTKTYITEVLTYIKNESKWKAAKHFAESKGWSFHIWTEATLEQLGLKILSK